MLASVRKLSRNARQVGLVTARHERLVIGGVMLERQFELAQRRVSIPHQHVHSAQSRVNLRLQNVRQRVAWQRQLIIKLLRRLVKLFLMRQAFGVQQLQFSVACLSTLQILNGPCVLLTPHQNATHLQ